MSLDLFIRKWNHRRIDFFRALKLKISILLFGSFSRFCEKSTQHNILVLRMDDKIGDSITATGFLRELKLKHPESAVVVVAGTTSAELYRELEFVDEVLVSKKGIFSTLRVFFRLRGQNYLYLINTSHILNPRVIFLSSFLSAWKKLTFANAGVRAFSDFVDIDFKKDHVTDRYRKTLEKIGIEDAVLDYEIKLNEKDLYLAAQYIDGLRAKTKFVVGLNSFAGGKLRNFSKKTTVAFVNRLLENKDVTVLSLAGKGDHEVLDLWFDVIVHERWVHNEELCSLGMNLALASLCDVIVTPDTAWVHIASALKKKLVAVFRMDDNSQELNSVIWAPYKTEARVIFAPVNPPLPPDVNSVDIDQVVAGTLDFLVR